MRMKIKMLGMPKSRYREVYNLAKEYYEKRYNTEVTDESEAEAAIEEGRLYILFWDGKVLSYSNHSLYYSQNVDEIVVTPEDTFHEARYLFERGDLEVDMYLSYKGTKDYPPNTKLKVNAVGTMGVLGVRLIQRDGNSSFGAIVPLGKEDLENYVVKTVGYCVKPRFTKRDLLAQELYRKNFNLDERDVASWRDEPLTTQSHWMDMAQAAIDFLDNIQEN